MSKINRKVIGVCVLSTVCSAASVVASDIAGKPMISPKSMADALHMVMDSDRAV